MGCGEYEMRSTQFKERYGPWAVVAGASQGIGEAYSRQLAARGLDLILIARGAAALEELAAELRATHGVEVRVLPMDLGRPDLDEAFGAAVTGLEIGLLVYNACYSTVGEFFEHDLASKQTIVDVNCRGPLTLVSALAPPMLERGRGGILLMSSASGFQGAGLIATYAASKAFNTVLGEGLWEEFRHSGVDVLSFAAGATSTPNFEEVTPQDKQAASFPMTPEAVVTQALGSLGKGPTDVAGALNKGLRGCQGVSRPWPASWPRSTLRRS